MKIGKSSRKSQARCACSHMARIWHAWPVMAPHVFMLPFVGGLSSVTSTGPTSEKSQNKVSSLQMCAQDIIRITGGLDISQPGEPHEQTFLNACKVRLWSFLRFLFAARRPHGIASLRT